MLNDLRRECFLSIATFVALVPLKNMHFLLGSNINCATVTVFILALHICMLEKANVEPDTVMATLWATPT
jgi:hypothetical protein